MTVTQGQLLDIIKSESARYGLPLDITIPLIDAESSYKPDAVNGNHYGLLQLTPDYAGGHYTPAQLLDPTFNLEAGLPAIAQAYKAIGSPKNPSLTQYNQVLTHSGHDQWTGSFSGDSAAQHFDFAYMNDAAEARVIEGQRNAIDQGVSAITGIPGDLGHVAGQVGNDFGQLGNKVTSLTDALNAAKNGAGAFVAFLGWMKDNPGYVAVLLAAGLIFLGSAMHLANSASGGQGGLSEAAGRLGVPA